MMLPICKVLCIVICLIVCHTNAYTIENVPKTDLNQSITIDGKPQFRIPYLVSVQGFNTREDRYLHLCLGTIIDKHFIITAAHCFHEYAQPIQVSVVVGDEVNINPELVKNRLAVREILRHDYYIPLYGFDAALLKLWFPIKLNGDVLGKIELNFNDRNMYERTPAYLIGYNKKNYNTELMSFLTMTNEVCIWSGYRRITRTEICGKSQFGRGGCDGDSGGALVDTQFGHLLGMLSYSKTPCEPKEIFVFTRITSLLDWIEQTMQEHSDTKYNDEDSILHFNYV